MRFHDAGELAALDLRSGAALWRVDKERVGHSVYSAHDSPAHHGRAFSH